MWIKLNFSPSSPSPLVSAVNTANRPTSSQTFQIVMLFVRKSGLMEVSDTSLLNRTQNCQFKNGGRAENTNIVFFFLQSICKHLGPGNSTCVCREGWIGDGVVCEKKWTKCITSKDCKVNGSICVLVRDLLTLIWYNSSF